MFVYSYLLTWRYIRYPNTLKIWPACMILETSSILVVIVTCKDVCTISYQYHYKYDSN